MNREELRNGEVICKVTPEEVEELEGMVLDQRVLDSMMNDILSRKRKALIKTRAFWEKLSEKYFLSGLEYHIDYRTRELKKGNK